MRATGPNHAAHLLPDVLDVLNELGIPNALIGAMAASYYGVPRATAEAHALIWLSRAGKSALEVTNRLLAAGYRAQLKRGDIDDPIPGAILVEDAYGNRTDLLLGVRGMDPDAVQRCVNASLLDSSVRIIAAEDLIPMKIFAGGFHDLEDVREILQVSGTLLDLELLRRLAGGYGPEVVSKLDELLNESPV